jgi:hypothetical protein
MEHGVARFGVDCGPVVRYVHTSRFSPTFVIYTVLIGSTFGGHIEQGSSTPHFLCFLYVPLVNLHVVSICVYILCAHVLYMKGLRGLNL